jgi:hypothetical protein
VAFTWWGSVYGPAMFCHVRCRDCGYAYNGRTGRSNLIPAVIFVTIPAVLILLILGFIAFAIILMLSDPRGRRLEGPNRPQAPPTMASSA